MAKTYEPIATGTYTGGSNYVTFSSIPATYTDLRVVITGVNSSGATNFWIQLNSDFSTSPTNYSMTNLRSNGNATVLSQSTTTFGDNAIKIYNGSTAAGIAGFAIFDILSYANSKYKTVLVTGSTDTNGSGDVIRVIGMWKNTAAITAIRCVSSSGSDSGVATLYGIKAA